MTEIIIGTTPTITYKFKTVSPSEFRACILTITAIGTFLGMILGISTVQYNKKE